ncbi:MAG: carbamoyltransferase, partial [Alphaproteobacteria bacterium]|nr:carbamoyltransferase [Alphaproteobacteria bacterium]
AMRSVIPAVTHADGTARVQVVSESSNPLFCRLLYEFGTITGVPVLMNTSFNLRGEPVVETPEDALNTFVASGMDNLVMGRHVVHKGLAL